MMISTMDEWEPRCQHPAQLSSSLLRRFGQMADEFSARGLVVWLDDADLWHWRWRGTGMRCAEGVGGLGEAIADAVAARFPAYFEHPPMLDRAVSG